MPNHVTTRCLVTGPSKEVAAFRADSFSTEEGKPYFDFHKIIPQPEILRGIEESSASEIGMALIIARGSSTAPFANLGLYDVEIKRIRDDVAMPQEDISKVAAAFLAKNRDYERNGQLRLRALAETGFASWYPWSIAKWGTKWNSYDLAIEREEHDFEFRFDTAWSFPTPIFEKLAGLYPTLKFHCWTFDEGHNFAGEGCFNPADDDRPFEICKANAALFDRVYGHPPEKEDAA